MSSEEGLEEKFTKRFETTYALPVQSGNINTQFEFYYGPTDYKTLQDLEGDLEASIPMGWGIFGWINRVLLFAAVWLFVFVPFVWDCHYC